MLLAAKRDEGALAAAVVPFVVPSDVGARLSAVLLVPVSVDPTSAVLLKPAESLEPAFAAPALAVLLDTALGAATPVVLLPAAPGEADPPASV